MAKKPGVDVMIAMKPHKPGADLSAPGPLEHGGPPAPGDSDGDEQEPDGDECQPNPVAVCYRTEAQTCQYCHYMQGDSCTHPMVKQQVGPGDGCNAFEDKGDEGSETGEQGPGAGAPGAPPAGGFGQS